MKRVALTMITVVGSLLSMGAGESQAADRYALVKVVNTSNITLNFQYQFDNGEWRSASLKPGHWYGIYAGFTAPGSYKHSLIRLRYDEDLRLGRDHYRLLTPYVKYSPDIDYHRAQVYHFGYDGALQQFVDMFRIDY